jgi:hypothetical protein
MGLPHVMLPLAILRSLNYCTESKAPLGWVKRLKYVNGFGRTTSYVKPHFTLLYELIFFCQQLRTSFA